jgi:N-hydroxyarylamine O-acetyltransferase
MLDLDSYLARIDYTGRLEPTLDTLRALHARHPRAIPFENLDTLLGRAVPLDLASLQRKLVQQRRGGYCFEQNTLFKSVLEAVGMRTTALAARVLWDRPDGATRARTHMVLLVELGPSVYLADVGFGGLTPTGPLELRADREQDTPHETFRVVRLAREFAVEARVREEWRRLYVFDLQEQRPSDIEVLNHYVVSHADSPMLGRLIVARTEPDRRFGLGNALLKTHHKSGASEERRIGSVSELRAVLRTTFRIDAPEGDESDAALERVLD